jgi:hypothetical protein
MTAGTSSTTTCWPARAITSRRCSPCCAAQKNRRVEFTGGLEALSLQDYQVDLLASLKPRPNMFFAYDPGDAFETLEARRGALLAAGFTTASHRMRVYVLIGYPKDTFDLAEAAPAADDVASASRRTRCCGSRKRRRRRSTGLAPEWHGVSRPLRQEGGDADR